MMPIRCYLFLPLMVAGSPLMAQQTVSGRIFSGSTDSLIRHATVVNKGSGQIRIAGIDGRYNIGAMEGDSLVFSAVGYVSDTTIVEFHMLLTDLDIALPQRIISLAEVKVTSDYSADSLASREYYKHILAKQAGITGHNRPENGFGIVFSPVSHFSRESKQKRNLRKRLLRQEQDDFIDRSFPAEWVARLTGLRGDSLRLFMYRYRPSYEFCRKTDRMGMLVYINDKFREFRKPKR